MPKQCEATIIENRCLTGTVFSLKLRAPELANDALPGQFVHVKCGEGSLLRRPISICDAKDDVVTIVVEARGEGTKWISGRKAGERLDLLGPLGHGFDLSGRNVILVGGGIGVPPMFYAARSHNGNATAILGFRNKDSIILSDEFKRECKELYITTDDGSFGEHGFVTAPLKRLLESGGYDAVLACGPKAMLKTIAELSAAKGVPCQVSMEERMGCGIGACLVCACKTQREGKEEMRHVCKDGPVFNAAEVVW